MERKFKTNINCDSCVSTITPTLNAIEGIENWEVDTSARDKILKVEAGLDLSLSATIIEKVKQSGFKIEPAPNGFFQNLLNN